MQKKEEEEEETLQYIQIQTPAHGVCAATQSDHCRCSTALACELHKKKKYQQLW